jgi:hypothetical protein
MNCKTGFGITLLFLLTVLGALGALVKDNDVAFWLRMGSCISSGLVLIVGLILAHDEYQTSERTKRVEKLRDLEADTYFTRSSETADYLRRGADNANKGVDVLKTGQDAIINKIDGIRVDFRRGPRHDDWCKPLLAI